MRQGLLPPNAAVVLGWTLLASVIAMLLLAPIPQDPSYHQFGDARYVFGIASILYWRFSGDLRFYAWVQFTPLLIVLALGILGWGGDRRSSRHCVWRCLCYVLAKIAEAFDSTTFCRDR